MKVFHKIASTTHDIKCHYPGCQALAGHLLEGHMSCIFLCDEHKATEWYIAETQNLPYDDGDALYLSLTTDELADLVG